MRASIFLLLMLCLIPCFKVEAQDFHLTQYEAMPLHLNPGLTGLFSGKYRICGTYRSQWASITPNPYTTAGLSYDQAFKKGAGGLQVLNERAGTGNYNVLSILASGSIDLSPGNKKLHHFSVGGQAGFIQKSVNISRLTFDEQYRYTNGGGFDPSVGSGESQAGLSIFLPDLNAGVVYFYSNDLARFNPFAGVSAYHLNRPKESFFSMDNRLPIRYVTHYGFKYSINEKIQVIPKFLMMQQSNAKEIITSITTHYYLDNSDTYLIFSPIWRNNDAMVLELGMKMKSFTYRLSYDLNYSTLKTATNQRGGMEFSIIFTARKQPPAMVPNCPRL